MQLDQSCFVCGNRGTKRCSRCKSVQYCSEECQSKDWISGHKNSCNKLALSTSLAGGLKASFSGSNSAGISPVTCDKSQVIIQAKKILCPYDEFITFFNSDMPGLPPCGLINCGNSCFANVVLQCLSFTKPLVSYLLKKGHRRECKRNDWCFLCEFQAHVERVSQNLQPFSPFKILSRLSNLGGNLGYGTQEDAHEFMRFAIDTMQSDCLEEFGGERAVQFSSEETTLIQHIFGGQLQSQVICTQCKKVSNRYENMMDLTVEIHGNASALEECLNQFTAKESLDGENMYKCDRCNDYVKALKRLTIQTPPNILTIALKRFQSGRFGKLNKEVTFPETLDLSPYMSEAGGATDVYKLYAVAIHLDMLNASYFGHYICYAKNFRGNWYEIDDCKVRRVSLKEVLSQGAYMLLYSRVSVRPLSLKATEHLEDEKLKVEPCSRKRNNSFSPSPTCRSLSYCEREFSVADDFGSSEELEYTDITASSSNSSLSSFDYEYDSSSASSTEVSVDMNEDTPIPNSPTLKEILRQEEESSILNNFEAAKRARQITVVDTSFPALLAVAYCNREQPGVAGKNLEDSDSIKSKSSAALSNGHATMECDDFQVKEAQDMLSLSFHSSDEISAKVDYRQSEVLHTHNVEDGNGV